MEASTKKKIWKAVGILALIIVLVWAYRKLFPKTDNNLPKETTGSKISYGNGLGNTVSNETLTIAKPSKKACPAVGGKCNGGSGTLFLVGFDSTGCHYGCYTSSSL